MTPSRLRRWVNGYTYRLDRESSDVLRARPPVLQKSDLPDIRGATALSFLELMELRVIRISWTNLGFRSKLCARRHSLRSANSNKVPICHPHSIR